MLEDDRETQMYIDHLLTQNGVIVGQIAAIRSMQDSYRWSDDRSRGLTVAWCMNEIKVNDLRMQLMINHSAMVRLGWKPDKDAKKEKPASPEGGEPVEIRYRVP